MNSVFRILQLIYFVYAALLFLALMLPVALFAVFVSPAGAVHGGNLIQAACRLWADIWFPLVGIFHKNIKEQEEETRTFIYVVNHLSWLDAALVMKAFRSPLRPLGKAEIGRLPVFGLIYRRAVVSVDRSSAEARQRSVFRLKSVLRKGISILVFPEGTFNNTGAPLASFFDGAFRIAIETSTPIRPVLFLDTHDRMPYGRAFSLNPGKSRAVFLDAVPVDGLGPGDVAELRERVFRLMEEKLKAYGASWVKKENPSALTA